MLVEQRKIYLLDVILTFLPILLALCVVWYAPETIASRFDFSSARNISEPYAKKG